MKKLILFLSIYVAFAVQAHFSSFFPFNSGSTDDTVQLRISQRTRNTVHPKKFPYNTLDGRGSVPKALNNQFNNHRNDFLTPRTLTSNAQHAFSNDLHIFWASESASPGEEISVQGYFSDTAQVCLAVNDNSQYIQLTRISQQIGYIKAELPDSLPLGVYQIWIKEGATRSQSHFINQAEGDCFNSPDVYSKANVCVKGRNLLLTGKTPTIRFVSQNSGASLLTTYIPTGSNKFKLNFAAPTGLVTGTKYSVYVSNGYGGNFAESLVRDELVAITPTLDTFNLGVAWHARFIGITSNVYNAKRDTRITNRVVGNGVNNDLPAIQAALNKAGADGGGIVFLPAGTYLCKGEGFVGLGFPSNVILKGAGKGLTILKYGIGSTINKFIGTYKQKNVGICDLSIQCQDTTGVFGAGLFQGENIFFRNIQWELKKGEWLEIVNSIKVAIVDCDFRHGTNNLIHGPTSISNSEYVTINRNNLIFVACGVQVNYSSKCFVENNVLIRDVSMPIISGSTIHVMICDFIENGIFANNQLLVGNGSIPRNTDGTPRINDGESIISENGGPLAPDLDYGQVSSATANTLNDATKSWATKFDLNPVVAIVKGKGSGQVRKIVSRTATTLTLDSTWNVLPDNTSSYSIFNYGLERVAFLNNEIHDQQRGLTFYFNPMQRVDIVGNRLINAGSIDITTIQEQDETGKKRFSPVYNIEIDNNYVDGSTDPYNGVSIGIRTIQHSLPNSWGTICTNLRIVHNTLVGAIPNKKVIQDETFPSGYHNYLVYHGGSTNYLDKNVAVILGTIFGNNTAKNLEKAVYLSTGSYQTSIIKVQLQNSPILVNDNQLNGSGHASVGTIIN